MIYISITNFVPNSLLKKDNSVIETRRLKNVVMFFQTIISFALSTKINQIQFSNKFYTEWMRKTHELYHQ